MKKITGPTQSRFRQVIKAIDKRKEIVRSQVRAVVENFTTALFVYGPGGLGKTHLITAELDSMLGKRWIHHTAYTTPKGLILALAENPDSIHLFEDCEQMYKHETCSSILRAACGSPRQKNRIVTYQTANENITINFRGGIIIVSNEAISKGKGALAAVASRFSPIKWDLNVEERISSILEIAEGGYTKNGVTLNGKACLMVAKELIHEILNGGSDRPVDLRTFTEHALPTYCQFLATENPDGWIEVMRSKLKGEVQRSERRDDKSNRLQLLAWSIAQDKTLNTKQRVEKWKEETGLGQAIYYRHLKHAKFSMPAN